MLNFIIVDDETSIEIIAKNKFRKDIKEGKMIFSFFSSATQCLEYLDQNYTPEKITVIVSDINMPEMDGFEFGSIILNKYKKIPFFFMSAYDFPDYKKKAQLMGVNGYFTKPVNLNYIKEEIYEFMSRL